jgi:hypothetical protein
MCFLFLAFPLPLHKVRIFYVQWGGDSNRLSEYIISENNVYTVDFDGIWCYDSKLKYTEQILVHLFLHNYM